MEQRTLLILFAIFALFLPCSVQFPRRQELASVEVQNIGGRTLVFENAPDDFFPPSNAQGGSNANPTEIVEGVRPSHSSLPSPTVTRVLESNGQRTEVSGASGGVTSSECKNCVTFAGCSRWVFVKGRYRCAKRSRRTRPRNNDNRRDDLKKRILNEDEDQAIVFA